MSYKQLTQQQRYHIDVLWKAGYTQSHMADEVGVHKSTITREMRRNSRWKGYYPEQAQAFCDYRRERAKKHIKFTDEVKAYVKEKLLLNWSPEQISGVAKSENLFSISHERIYQYILADKKYGGKLYTYLRQGHKKYKKRYGSPARGHLIKNRKFIEERPAIVDDKSRIGDWEIDTIIGKKGKQAIVTIVERVSKKTLLKKVEFKTAKLVADATIEALRSLPRKVFTITGDNGSEFCYHQFISKTLDAEFYFAHPYSAWERGVNENTNGLVRQYLRKGCDFSPVTDDDLIFIMDRLNNRPRKTLGYKTPNEVFAMEFYSQAA